MADVNTQKLQLRSGLSINGDKTPSPATKLLINHGKPNFTIQRSPKIQNGNANPMSPPANNEFVVKSTTFNGVFKPSNISVATKQSIEQNGTSSGENEASKVVLRRAKAVEAEIRDDEDKNVPEFIRRQRRIQERLANQNILDFENRRSGYFTHVMISPTNPNRQSFVETMASPAVMPSLEIPPPLSPVQKEKVEEEPITEEVVEEQQPIAKNEEAAVAVTLNGAEDEEEEEVAKAIEEVNKAVAGEEDDKPEVGETEQIMKSAIVDATTSVLVEETKQEENIQVEEVPIVAVTSTLVKESIIVDDVDEEIPAEETHIVAAVVTSALVEESPVEELPILATVISSDLENKEEQSEQSGHVEAVVTSAAIIDEPQTNNDIELALQNGHSHASAEITISHTNGLNGPSIPSPDPSGEKGVNFEPKTVVSFSQELGSDINKYPDTVKVVKDSQTPEIDEELKELTKLKFEIKADEQDIEVKPVLVTETA